MARFNAGMGSALPFGPLEFTLKREWVRMLLPNP